MSEADKGEYKLVVDDDADKRGSVSYPEGAQIKAESVASHPALPVLCYCVASISMTVINKASCSAAAWRVSRDLRAFYS